MDFKDPKWNRDAFARLQGSLDPTETHYGHYFGTVLGVTPNERVQELCGFEGFSATRLLHLEDGSYRKLLRETVFYRDPVSGKLLDEWKNPWTGEVVKVVNVANDPFNLTIGEYYPDPPDYGGLNKEKPPKRPLLLNWRLIGDNTLALTTDIHLYYPNALQPDKWPRESSGRMAQVSEMFRYIIRLEDMQNPEAHVGALQRHLESCHTVATMDVVRRQAWQRTVRRQHDCIRLAQVHSGRHHQVHRATHAEVPRGAGQGLWPVAVVTRELCARAEARSSASEAVVLHDHSMSSRERSLASLPRRT